MHGLHYDDVVSRYFPLMQRLSLGKVFIVFVNSNISLPSEDIVISSDVIDLTNVNVPALSERKLLLLFNYLVLVDYFHIDTLLAPDYIDIHSPFYDTIILDD